jgi:DNA-binding NarL/FixJ family response regulator
MVRCWKSILTSKSSSQYWNHADKPGNHSQHAAQHKRSQKNPEYTADFLNRVDGRSERMTTAMSKVTAAERRVLRLVSLARTNKEIAVELGISPATVKRHVENILRKLQLRNRVDAAIYGLIIAGCPQRSGPDCPLEAWQRERAAAD